MCVNKHIKQNWNTQASKCPFMEKVITEQNPLKWNIKTWTSVERNSRNIGLCSLCWYLLLNSYIAITSDSNFYGKNQFVSTLLLCYSSPAEVRHWTLLSAGILYFVSLGKAYNYVDISMLIFASQSHFCNSDFHILHHVRFWCWLKYAYRMWGQITQPYWICG